MERQDSAAVLEYLKKSPILVTSGVIEKAQSVFGEIGNQNICKYMLKMYDF